VRARFAKSRIAAIAQTPHGYLWLATGFGLLRFDGVRATPWAPPAGGQLPGDNIFRLLVSRDGALGIGTKLTRYPEFAGAIVRALVQDPEGTIWASAKKSSQRKPLRHPWWKGELLGS